MGAGERGLYIHGSLSIIIWYGVQLQNGCYFLIRVMIMSPPHCPLLRLTHLLVVFSLLVSHKLSSLLSAVVALVAFQRLVVVDVPDHMSHEQVSTALAGPTARAKVASGIVAFVVTDVVLTDVVLIEGQCRHAEDGVGDWDQKQE